MTAREFQTILWEQDGGIGTITINRPEQFNGMTNTMLRETHELLHDVADEQGGQGAYPAGRPAAAQVFEPLDYAAFGDSLTSRAGADSSGHLPALPWMNIPGLKWLPLRAGRSGRRRRSWR